MDGDTAQHPKYLEFDKSFSDGRLIPLAMGRLYLGKGQFVVRLILAPDGLHLFVPHEAIEAGFVDISEPATTRLQDYVLGVGDSKEG